MTAVAVVALSKPEARALTERIKSSAEQLWVLLLDAHERQAWRALGYASWTAYVEAEFPFNRARSYQLVAQGKVIRAIEEAAGLSTNVDIREGPARRLTTKLPAITADIRERVARGEEPEEAVSAAVRAARQPLAPDKPGIVVTKGNAPDVALRKAMEALDATCIVFRSITVEQLPDDAPAVRVIKEIDDALKILRAMRTQLRGRYGIT